MGFSDHLLDNLLINVLLFMVSQKLTRFVLQDIRSSTKHMLTVKRYNI